LIISLFFTFILSFLGFLISSANLEIVNDSYSVIIGEKEFKNPFLGGLNYPRTHWYDFDVDGDNDLFILDEDGCIRYYNYDNSEFKIVSTSFGELCGMTWFDIIEIDQDNSIEIACQSLAQNNQVEIYDLINNNFLLLGTLNDINGFPIISDPSMNPTFEDIDGDGDLDFFTGNVIGTVTFYENVSQNSFPPVYELKSFEWQNIWIVGPSIQSRHGASAINFIDIDSDEDLDLFWGDYFQRSIYMITNEGDSSNPSMNYQNIISDFPPNEPIYTSGRNMPTFNDIDADGDLDLFVSVLGGDGGIQLKNNFLFYENSEDIFNLESNNFLESIDFNSNVAPSLVDIDADGDLDLFIGQDYSTETFPIRGRLHFFRNTGEAENIFELEQDSFLGYDIGTSLVPVFADIDSDGDLDLFIGNYNGNIIFYLNDGDSENMNFLNQGLLPNVSSQSFSSPAFNDIDSDGDLDLFVGDNSGNVLLFTNTGNQYNFNFILTTDTFSNINVGSRSSINFFDFDNDLSPELIVGSANQGLKIFKQKSNSIFFNEVECIEYPHLGLNTKPFFYHENNKIMGLTGVSTGGFWNSVFVEQFGDLNSDSTVDVNDVILIVEQIIYKDTSIDECEADFNFDNRLDLLDILKLVFNIIS
tara:strand:- start:137 stop:2062 length:1926 start_codon:yes stop_codon:yes gene_type:complete